MIEVKINDLIWSHKTSIEKISKSTGISRTTISNLKNNYSKGISWEVLNKLIIYFDCEVGDVIGYKDIEWR